MAEGWESISFINRASMTLGVDDIPCVIGVAVVASRRTGVMALILIPRPGLATRVIVLICFLVVFLSSRSPTVVGNRWSRVLSSNLMQGVSGQALNFADLGGYSVSLALIWTPQPG